MDRNGRKVNSPVFYPPPIAELCYIPMLEILNQQVKKNIKKSIVSYYPSVYLYKSNVILTLHLSIRNQ